MAVRKGIYHSVLCSSGGLVIASSKLPGTRCGAETRNREISGIALRGGEAVIKSMMPFVSKKLAESGTVANSSRETNR